MKKARILLLLFIAICSLFFLTACGQSKGDNTAGNAVNNYGNIANRRPDFGQPDRPADANGLVKSITGNEVTIIKIDRPNRASSTPASEDASGDSANNNDQGAQVSRRMLVSGGTGGAGRPGGGQFYMRDSGPGGPDGGNGTTDRTAMLERLKAMSSGDEKVIIPVGIKMLKPDSTDNSANSSVNRQPNMVEATLADITADKMVQIWLDPNVTDRKVAEFVLVMR
jgi:hypothetical protein